MFVRKPAVPATPVADAARKLGSKVATPLPSPERTPTPWVSKPRPWSTDAED